jgi:hypothetical protein
LSECLFTDGTHGPAEVNDDLCPPCRARFERVREEELQLAALEDVIRRSERPGLFGELTSSAL